MRDMPKVSASDKVILYLPGGAAYSTIGQSYAPRRDFGLLVMGGTVTTLSSQFSLPHKLRWTLCFRTRVRGTFFRNRTIYSLLLYRRLRAKMLQKIKIKDHLAWTAGTGIPCPGVYPTQGTSCMETARVKQEEDKNHDRVVWNMDKRNVGIKGKSPKLYLTIELPESPPAID